MAEEQDIERELPASQKRLDEARERGQAPRSRELTSALLLLGGGATVLANGAGMVADARAFLRAGLTISRERAFDTGAALEGLGNLVWHGFAPAAPVLAALFIIALAAPVAVGGWIFSTTPLAPDFSRLDPMKGLANMFSTRSLAELGKAVAKVALIGTALGWLVWRDREAFVAPLAAVPADALAGAGSLIARDFVWMAAVLLVIAAFDVPLQLWQHARGLRMTAEELKREAKESEGDPQIKSKIRARQREAARRRMMSAVPKADVVVTNPTHFAVALAYNAEGMRAPRVVAKGTDEVAARIREIARENGVPLLEAPPLARALYAHAEIESEIPAALYNAVALVLAWVYQLRAALPGRPPEEPRHLPVPEDLDPGVAGVPA